VLLTIVAPTAPALGTVPARPLRLLLLLLLLLLHRHRLASSVRRGGGSGGVGNGCRTLLLLLLPQPPVLPLALPPRHGRGCDGLAVVEPPLGTALCMWGVCCSGEVAGGAACAGAARLRLAAEVG
jgi:hypothetical protein